MSKRVQGSIKNKVTATELVEERARCNFDKEELKAMFMTDPEGKHIMEKALKDQMEDPNLALTHKFYEMEPAERQLMWMKKLNYLWFNKDRKFYFTDGNSPEYNWIWQYHGQPPIGLHMTMFRQSIETFSSPA